MKENSSFPFRPSSPFFQCGNTSAQTVRSSSFSCTSNEGNQSGAPFGGSLASADHLPPEINTALSPRTANNQNYDTTGESSSSFLRLLPSSFTKAGGETGKEISGVAEDISLVSDGGVSPFLQRKEYRMTGNPNSPVTEYPAYSNSAFSAMNPITGLHESALGGEAPNDQQGNARGEGRGDAVNENNIAKSFKVSQFHPVIRDSLESNDVEILKQQLKLAQIALQQKAAFHRNRACSQRTRHDHHPRLLHADRSAEEEGNLYEDSDSENDEVLMQWQIVSTWQLLHTLRQIDALGERLRDVCMSEMELDRSAFDELSFLFTEGKDREFNTQKNEEKKKKFDREISRGDEREKALKFLKGPIYGKHEGGEDNNERNNVTVPYEAEGDEEEDINNDENLNINTYDKRHSRNARRKPGSNPLHCSDGEDINYNTLSKDAETKDKQKNFYKYQRRKEGMKWGRLSEGQVVRKAFAECRSLRVLLAICRWLKWEKSNKPTDAYKSTDEESKEQYIVYSGTPSVDFHESILKYEHSLRLSGGMMSGVFPPSLLFYHLDWQFDNKKENVITKNDRRALQLFFKKLWHLIRMGAIKTADKFVTNHRQFWLMSIIHGSEVYMDGYSMCDSNLGCKDSDLITFDERCHLSDQEWITKPCLWPSAHTVKDIPLDAEAEMEVGCLSAAELGKIGDGNKWRPLFKQICRYIACKGAPVSSPGVIEGPSEALSKMSVHERAIYGFASGDLKSCLGVAEDWKDFIFASCHCLKETIIEVILQRYRERQPNERFACEMRGRPWSSKLPNFVSFCGFLGGTNLEEVCLQDLDQHVFDYLHNLFRCLENYNGVDIPDVHIRRKIRNEACEDFSRLQSILILSQLQPNMYRKIYDMLHLWNEEGIVFNHKRICPVTDGVRQFMSYFTVAHEDMQFDSISSPNPVKPSVIDRDVLIGGFIREVVKYGCATPLADLLVEKVAYLSHEAKIQTVADFMWQKFRDGKWSSEEGLKELQAAMWRLSLNFQRDMFHLVVRLSEMAWTFADIEIHEDQQIVLRHERNMEIRDRIQFVICCILTLYKIVMHGDVRCTARSFLGPMIIGSDDQNSRMNNEFYSDRPSLQLCCVLTSEILATIHAGLYCLSLVTHLSLIGCLHEVTNKLGRLFEDGARRGWKTKSRKEANEDENEVDNEEQNVEKSEGEYVSMKDFLECSVCLDLYEPLLSKIADALAQTSPLPQNLSPQDLQNDLSDRNNHHRDIESFLLSFKGDLYIGDTPIPLEGIHQFVGLKEYVKSAEVANRWKIAAAKFSRVKHLREAIEESTQNDNQKRLYPQKTLKKDECKEYLDALANLRASRGALEEQLKNVLVKLRRGLFPVACELDKNFDCEQFLALYYHLPRFCGGTGIPSRDEDPALTASDEDLEEEKEDDDVTHTGLPLTDGEREITMRNRTGEDIAADGNEYDRYYGNREDGRIGGVINQTDRGEANALNANLYAPPSSPIHAEEMHRYSRTVEEGMREGPYVYRSNINTDDSDIENGGEYASSFNARRIPMQRRLSSSLHPSLLEKRKEKQRKKQRRMRNEKKPQEVETDEGGYGGNEVEQLVTSSSPCSSSSSEGDQVAAKVVCLARSELLWGLLYDILSSVEEANDFAMKNLVIKYVAFSEWALDTLRRRLGCLLFDFISKLTIAEEEEYNSAAVKLP